MRIPEDKIEEVRNAVNIVDVVGSVVRLKKSGKNYVGLCPFHQEKTPSFSVNTEKQIYKCFGCGEGGNVFSFIMKDQNISFIDVLRQLGEKVGISLPQYKEDPGEKKQIEKLYAVNEFAAQWYGRNLRETEEGKKALEYLRSRGFKKETIIEFQLGYAPDEWEGLVKVAAKAAFDRNALLEVGLALRKSPSSTPYDRFRNRIIFPIKNEFGRTTGFGARAFDEKDDAGTPKYINSPESPVYHKGRLLYGLFQNKDTIRKEDLVILVEGYTDVMALSEFGISLGIATLGTAMTPRQAQLINRYTQNVVLLYDADAPGVKAALRGSEVLFRENLDVQVVNLGENADPDSFLRKHSKEAFINAIKNRQSIVDFYASSFSQSGGALPYNVKSERIRGMIDLVDSVKDSLKRDLMLQEIGEKLSTDVKSIFKEFYRKKRAQFRRPAGEEQKHRGKKRIVDEIDRIERELGSIIVNEPDLARFLLNAIEIEDIRSPQILRIIEIIKTIDANKKSYSPADVISAAEDENLQRIISDLAFIPHEFPKQNEEEFHERLVQVSEDLVSRLRERRFNRELDILQEKIKKAESEGADTQALASQYNDLLQRKSADSHNQNLI